MRILILGGSGFIGSHLFDRLQQVHEVILTGKSARYPWGPVINPHKYIQFDLSDLSPPNLGLLRDLINEVDVVIHSVSSTVPATANAAPRQDIEQNLLPVVEILEILKGQITPKRLIYLSSGGTVYGAPEHLPVCESAPLLPLGAYGMVKVASENYIRMYHQLHQLPYQIFRVSNPYGLRQSKAGTFGLISTVFSKIKNNQPVTVWGKGDTSRDYIWIDDLIDLLEKAVTTDVDGTYNAGAGSSVSVNKILDLAEHITKQAIQRIDEPARGYDVPAIALNIDKAKQVFAWQPRVSLEQGMQILWHQLKG